MSETYTYSFTVLPHDSHDSGPPIYKLFNALLRRVYFEFTEDEFDEFRTSIERAGLDLVAIERVPYHEPEAIT